MAEGNKVLIIGSGGREHALGWAISRSPSVGKVYSSPGNGGLAGIGPCIDLPLSDHAALSRFADEEKINLILIGPEAPLVDGLADSLRAAGHRVVGVGKQAAQLEGSKIRAKLFMQKHGIPTADFKTFDSAEAAIAFAKSPEGRRFRVLKADGLAAGKGVIVAKDQAEVVRAIEASLVDRQFGSAGERILLEETLEGPEVSIIALCDGKTILPFSASQDHKRAFDGDEGPNTGGMGAYAPTPFYTEAVRAKVDRDVIARFLAGVQAEKMDFRGFIYFGLMLTPTGPKVLEFNVRFGDPEAQAVLPLVSSDFYQLMSGVADGRLQDVHVAHKNAFSCTVVMAAGGYPGSYAKGTAITGLDEAAQRKDVIVFHAGTQRVENKTVTAGGRVLAVTGTGPTLSHAVVRAYQSVKRISFEGSFFRTDIAAKALHDKRLLQRIRKMRRRRGRQPVVG